MMLYYVVMKVKIGYVFVIPDLDLYRASLVAQTVKNRLQCGRLAFDSWIRKLPWRREWLPTPVF